MGGSSPPPPQPAAPIIADQTAANLAAARSQYQMNATNQYAPGWAKTYNQIGTWDDGTPRFEQITTPDADQTYLYNLGVANQGVLGNIASQQLNKVGGILNTPFNIDAAAGTQQNEMYRALLDPQWAQREGSLDAKLANQGITSGSEAMSNAQRDFGDERARAYLAAALGSRGQAVQEALAEHNQPLNDITALMSGSQVGSPNFTNTPQVNVAAPDVAGINANAWNQGFKGWDAQRQSQDAMMGGLFGLAAAPLGGYAQGVGRAGGTFGSMFGFGRPA